MKNDELSSRMYSMARLGTPMAIRVAATLRLADHVRAGHTSTPELAAAVDADRDALERLMRYLAVRAIFDRDSTGRYALTALGETLLDDHPSKLRARLDIEGSLGRAELSFVQLLHTIKTGEPGFRAQFGRSFWDDWASDPGRAADFCKLTSDLESLSPELVAGYDWEPLGHVVDVGAGNGALMVALLTAFPSLRGTLLEMPDNSEPARQAIAEAGLTDRSELRVGSFFDPLPPGAGGYVLSFVLHNWPDEQAKAILRRCAEAAGSKGVVLVIEKTGPDAETVHTGMDLRMMTVIGGRERRISELAEVAGEAGLRLIHVHPAGPFSIVELGAR